ncbi:hypothetical protein P8452_68751 [Trifolium repens]|nr:hypothetical protein P8452_68751 [Trifolium repens]
MDAIMFSPCSQHVMELKKMAEENTSPGGCSDMNLDKGIKKSICIFSYTLQMVKIHHNEEISSYYKGFPVFGNLIILQLYWSVRGIHDCDEVVKMLQNCPKLQTLMILKWSNSTTKEDWKNRCHVPECVLSHLITCKIDGYKAVKADFRFTTLCRMRDFYRL